MNINELKTSNFLKRSDVGDGTLVTITGLSRENVAKEGAPEELKWVLHTAEFDKAMVLNSTNGQLISHALKSDESDDWTGKQIVLFDDPSVSYGGKLVGGIRVRAVPRTGAGNPAPRQAASMSTSVNAKAALKNKFKTHKLWGTKLTSDEVNSYMVSRWGAKLDELEPDVAQEALDCFDAMVQEIADNSIPF